MTLKGIDLKFGRAGGLLIKLWTLITIIYFFRGASTHPVIWVDQPPGRAVRYNNAFIKYIHLP